jgi:hypothetical protein
MLLHFEIEVRLHFVIRDRWGRQDVEVTQQLNYPGDLAAFDGCLSWPGSQR